MHSITHLPCPCPCHSFTSDIFLAQKIPPFQPNLRNRGMFAAHSAHLPLRESVRNLTDSMLYDSKEKLEEYTLERTATSCSSNAVVAML